MAAPHVKKLAEEMAGKAIVSVDTDQHPELGARFDVRVSRNFLVLKDARSFRSKQGWPHPRR